MAFVVHNHRHLHEHINSYDRVDDCIPRLLEGIDVARAESMDVSNDPRFFAGSIMNKRLAAFKSLTLVSGLMFATAVGNCYHIKKDMDFSFFDPYVGYFAYWELTSFLLSVVVASMCLLALYVITHQLFYTTRLTTAGPTGFEQATMFYTTRVVVVWRHLAVDALFNGLTLFIVLIGIQFFIKFYKDAHSKTDEVHELWVPNLMNGTSQEKAFIHQHVEGKLDMGFHALLGYIACSIFLGFTVLMCLVRYQHVTVFKINYAKAKLMSDPLEREVVSMASRRAGNSESSRFGTSNYYFNP